MIHVMEVHLISHTISSMHLVNDGYDALKTMLLAVYSHFVDTLIFIFFHLFHSFSLAINYLHITCNGFHYRGKLHGMIYICCLKNISSSSQYELTFVLQRHNSFYKDDHVNQNIDE